MKDKELTELSNYVIENRIRQSMQLRKYIERKTLSLLTLLLKLLKSIDHLMTYQISSEHMISL